MSLRSFFLVACIFSACAKPPAYVKCTDNMTKRYCQKIEASEHLMPIGQGGIFQAKKVSMVFADFTKEGTLSEEEAKEMLLSLVDRFITEANQDASLQEHLVVYPISPKEVSISVAFLDPMRKPLSGFSQIHLYEGQIHYSTYNPNTKSYQVYAKELL